jgi:uncharacterized membrane protein YuzA (DUF378 family)
VSTSQDPTPPENNNNVNHPEEMDQQEYSTTEEGVGGASTSSPVAQLPPEAQGEVNGGPLGCCLGVLVGLLLSLSVALISRFYADPLAHVLGGALSLITRIIMALVGLIAVIICGKFGWRIGKKLYREYDPPGGIS